MPRFPRNNLNTSFFHVMSQGINKEFIVFEEIYKQIALKYKTFNCVQIRNSIKYAIDNRNEQKSKANFEKVFGFEYDQYYFTNKTIIEEIARVIKVEFKI